MRKQRLTILIVIVLVTAAVYAVFFSKLFLGPDRGGKTVTVVLRSLNVRSDYWQTMISGAQTAAKELGIELDLQGPLQESDTDGQVQALKDAIARKPDALAVAPADDPRIPELLEDARKAGISLVVMDTPVTLSDPPVYVANDHQLAGRLAGDAAARSVHGSPAVAVFSDSPESSISLKRLDGIRAAMKEHGGRVTGTYYNGDSEQLAYEFAVTLLRSEPQFNAFITLNESATLGVAKALQEVKGTSRYKLIGFDSSIYEIQLLEEGAVSALLVQKPFNVGYLGVKTAIGMIDGRRTDKRTLIGSTVVTRDNMNDPDIQRLMFPFPVIQ
ncbi:substrate-binding domain-containing protein [Paenibacillus sacheonensis]|uniref:Substrate-binding domain-containing protein n=1 Tax=Paenibacillus sacheonensis TaxID=742054 RepID=A0A7X4YVN4_9BACL|nr:substrate-binding domain-containing protein [Paenibacillus sacheonensis]MBM7568679.1 ribose transport system substrate-binding protein [Paenibacillus sacheonensis]NBC72429.1 substrate-binding domain-containing protein [Paenibacillus sacheonensis]